MKQLLPMIRELASDDASLLANFASVRDEKAFAMLVRRHGPLVRGVCRRWLRQSADVDDAFQATFLVLVRRAEAIEQPAQLAGWLHGVAQRTARCLRDRETRRVQRLAREVELDTLPAASSPDCELAQLLDEEIGRLPDKYRLPVILCHLQGLSRREAARQLQCPEGTLSVRLARALGLLRRRLTRRGVAAALVAGLLAPVSVEAVSSNLLRQTVQNAIASAAPERIVSLTQGVLRMYVYRKLSRAAAFVLAACAMVSGGALLIGQFSSGSIAHADQPAKKAEAGPIFLNIRAEGDGSKLACIDIDEGSDRKATVYNVEMLKVYLKRARLDKTASDKIALTASRSLEFAVIVDVIEAIKSAGFTDVNIKITVYTPAREGVNHGGTYKLGYELDPATSTLKYRLLREVPLNLKLQSFEPKLTQLEGARLRSYKLLSEAYTKKLKDSTNPQQLQMDWMHDLQKFIETDVGDPDVPEAMLQLARMHEFAGKSDEALQWYQKLARQFPASKEAEMAAGAQKRLQSVGKRFELQNLRSKSDKPFKIEDLKGKAVVVYYWASWSPHAQSDFVALKALRNSHKGKLEIVLVNLDEQAEKAEQFVSRSPLADAVHLRLPGGFEGGLAASYGISVVPTTFLLDLDGKVVRHDIAFNALAAEIKKLMK